MSSHAGNSRSEIIPFVPDGCQSILDVGCSDGLFAELLQRERPGIVVDGVEPDPITASDAEGRMRNVYKGVFPGAVPAGSLYDCITFLDTLEHMVEPWDALRAALDHLTPTGVVVASLPNIRYAGALHTLLVKRDWPWDDWGIYDSTHYRFFTKTSMRRLFETSGYEVKTCAPINESRRLQARGLALVLGSDVKALQFALVARPARSLTF